MCVYDLRQNLDGSWSVYETQAGAPVIVDGLPQVALKLKRAEKVADTLSSAWLEPLQDEAKHAAAGTSEF